MAPASGSAGAKPTKPADRGALRGRSASASSSNAPRVTPVPAPRIPQRSVPTSSRARPEQSGSQQLLAQPIEESQLSVATMAPVPTAPPALMTVPGAEPAGFGVLAPAGGNATETTSGLPPDGRVKDPVPSKLKGVASEQQGNFQVMVMDLVGTGSAERGEIAKRTSEGTELAAKRALQNGYTSHRRHKFVQIPPEYDNTPASPPRPRAKRAGRPGIGRVVRGPLGPPATKAEQARLLTLLHSLHPVLVVDQLCKALAFFGGIPGAPPPKDGAFPLSAEANGAGNLFVGWIAEIFPPLEHEEANLDPIPNFQPIKRGRGRPKGSKATKYRSDKGVKKGPMRKSSPPPGEGQDGWEDVNDSVVDLSGDGTGAGSSATAGPQPAENTATNPIAPDFALPNVVLPKLKRGRPKGSKNRPKQGDSSAPRPRVKKPANPVTSLPDVNLSTSDGGGPNGLPNMSAHQTNMSVGTQQDGGGPHFAPFVPPTQVLETQPPIPPQSNTQPMSVSALSAQSAEPVVPVTGGPKRKRKSAKAPETALSPIPNGSSHEITEPGGGPRVDAAESANSGPPPAKRRRGPYKTKKFLASQTEPTQSEPSGSLTVDASLSSMHSPHQASFEVHSPTMENYEAQLQAQLEQQQENQSTNNRVERRPFVSTEQQQKQQEARRQALNAQSRSPNIQQQPPQRPPQEQQQTSYSSPYGQQYASQTQQQQQQQQQRSQPTSSQQHYSMTTNSYGSGGDNTYRASPATSATSSFPPRPTATAPQSVSQPQQQHRSPSSSYGTATPVQHQEQHQQRQHQPPSSTPSSSRQPATTQAGMSNTQGMPPFPSYGDAAGLFNMSAIGASSYSIGGGGGTGSGAGSGVARDDADPGAAFASSRAMEAFDASGKRYYGVRR